jgi:DNA processing protein
LDKTYPKRLSHYPDAPLLVYYKGNADLEHPRIVGIVGTRKPTDRGKAICEEIVEGLKDYGALIISGLAYGIDVAAHKKALELGMPTIGCLGHGLQMVYPSTHRKVAAGMTGHGGLLTEFSSNQKPDAPHFPMRNRVIAGMCDALIVVETARRGGSMITAEFANAYNKDVFAVPGRVKDAQSQGCNLLIKSHRAQLLDTPEDIAYIMRWEKEHAKHPAQRQLFVELNPQEQSIVDCLRGKESEGIDALSYGTGFSQSQLANLLLGLEFNGVLKSLPGKRYMLLE